jgi:PAS domain-containing protein
VFLSTRSPYRDAAEAVAGVVGISRDITDRKRAEEDREKFVALVEHSIDLIGMATLDGGVFYLNPAGRQLVGLGECEPAGGRIEDYVPADVAAL